MDEREEVDLAAYKLPEGFHATFEVRLDSFTAKLYRTPKTPTEVIALSTNEDSPLHVVTETDFSRRAIHQAILILVSVARRIAGESEQLETSRAYIAEIVADHGFNPASVRSIRKG